MHYNHQKKELQADEKRYKQLVEDASDIIYRVNHKGFFTYVNPIALRIMNSTEQEIIGKHFTDLIRADYRKIAENFYIKQFMNKTPFTYLEFPVDYNQSKEVWIGQNVKIIYEDGRINGFQAVARDITERKKFELDLLLAKEVAENSKKAKEQFLANMSHEIRTPMNAIVGMTDILQESELSLEQKECVDAIKISADNLLTVINDILDFSKIDSGKIIFEKTPFILEKVIEEIVQTLHFTADKKNITLTYSIANDIPKVLIGDTTRLRQILLNLASNSIKFTTTGSVTINLNLQKQEGDKYTILFKVIDTGIGISNEKLSTIFESFTQASNETTRKYGGTGLGLTIAKQLVELQGGLISVDSEIDKGSCFYFTLTFEKGDLKNVQTKTQKNSFSYSELQGINILLAEDNIMNQLFAKKLFKKWNCRYEIADNGKMAIEKLSKNSYDIVLMDMQMPEMDGYEATQYIRKNMPSNKSGIPIIAMTAHALVGEAEKCISLGMNDYISKPFNQRLLYEKIKTLIGKKKGKQAIQSTTSNRKKYHSKVPNKKYTDLTYLKKLSEGSNEFIVEIINKVFEQTPQMLHDMSLYVTQKKWAELRGVAHKMNPTIVFMGIHSLKEKIQNVEKYAGELIHLDLLPGLSKDIITTCDAALGELKIEIKKFQ